MSHPNNNGWQNELIDRLRSHTMALAVAAGNRPNDPQQQVHVLSDVQLGRLLEAAAYDVDYAAVLYWEMMADPSANDGDVNGHAGAGGNHDANLNVNDNNSNERRVRARYDYEEPEDVPSAALPGVDPDRAAAAAAADNNESLHMARLREHQQIMLMRNQHSRAQGQAMRLNQRFNPQLQQQADFFNQNANLNLNPNPANLNAQQARQQNAAAAAAAAALFAPQMQPQQAQQMQQEDAIGMAVQMRPQGQQQEHHQDQAQIPPLQRQQGNNRAAGAGPIMIINAISDDEQQQQQAFHQHHSRSNNHHTSSSNTSNSNIQQQDGDDDHFLQIQDSSLPSSVLWPPKLDSTSSQEEDDSSHHQRQDVAVQGHGNAVEVDTDMNGDQERSIRDNNCNNSRNRSEVPYIPGVWRSIGFSLSSTASGLSIFNKASLDSENEAISIDEGSDITGLLALVTSIMIANCAIQGREVTSSLIRPRFADLSSIDARYSYPNRLVDALSSLVWIALQARDCENQGGKRQKRANLFTAVRWKIAEDGSGQKTCESFATSKVHPQDVKAHIRSCISSFTSPGGCALFLETIMRIHGSERIQKMAETAKVKLPLIEANSENNRFEMNLPLMSLLMTGRIYSSWDGWGANNLGVGILNIDNCRNSFDYNSPLENQVLSRPNKSIWIIKGLEQYSVMWLSDQSDECLVQQPSSSFKLVHWNCLGDGCKTEFRVTTAPSRWKAKGAVTNTLLNIGSTQPLPLSRPAVLVDSDEIQSDTEGKIHRVKSIMCQHHPEDHKLYPDNYKLWRYNFQEQSTTENDNEDGIIPCNNIWTPYFLLSDMQKHFVELKFAPLIDIVAWTCWPGAVVDYGLKQPIV